MCHYAASFLLIIANRLGMDRFFLCALLLVWAVAALALSRQVWAVAQYHKTSVWISWRIATGMDLLAHSYPESMYLVNSLSLLLIVIIADCCVCILMCNSLSTNGLFYCKRHFKFHVHVFGAHSNYSLLCLPYFHCCVCRSTHHGRTLVDVVSCLLENAKGAGA